MSLNFVVKRKEMLHSYPKDRDEHWLTCPAGHYIILFDFFLVLLSPNSFPTHFHPITLNPLDLIVILSEKASLL